MSKPAIVFFPSPGVGHLISLVEFAKLVEPRFSVTVVMIPHVVPSWASAVEAYMDSVVSAGLDIVFEEFPHVEPPYRENQKPETFAIRMMESYKPAFKDAVSRLLENPSSSSSSSSRGSSGSTLSAVIIDWFCSSMIDVPQELGVPAYVYYTSNAAMLGSMLYLPTLHVEVPCEMKDVQGNIHMPGLPPVPPHCMPRILMDKKDEAYGLFVDFGRKFGQANGLIVNSFAELEPKAMQAIHGGDCLPDHPTPPVFAIGPVLATEPKKAGMERHECLNWLDGQPPASVVFLCFGSMGSFEEPQLMAIAEGLERSGQRFLWALRIRSSDKFRLPADADLDEVLPKGYSERTEGRGLVWPSWVPQAEILSHPSVGGFVTHCGWNSVLESLWFGVPMLGWPLYAEQHLNCLEMVKDMGVAVELRLDYSNGYFVSSEELERAVKSLMDCVEGKKVRAKVKEMQVVSRNTRMEGGSSYNALECLIGEVSKELPTIVHEMKDNSYVAPRDVARNFGCPGRMLKGINIYLRGAW